MESRRFNEQIAVRSRKVLRDGVVEMSVVGVQERKYSRGVTQRRCR